MGRGTHVLIDEAEARVKPHELVLAREHELGAAASRASAAASAGWARVMGWPRTATRGFASPMTLPGMNKSILPVRPVDARLALR